MSIEPVERNGDEEVRKPESGAALCLSGGGYRAMVFHVGVLRRLHEAGMLLTLKRVSSVSGGSITAGVLALKWPKLAAAPEDMAVFEQEVAGPVRAMAGVAIDILASVKGLLLPGMISDKVAESYDEHLFHGATLQSLPDSPRFVINATNVQSGVLWRFSKPYMRDYRVGEVRHPDLSLARAVAASSAFPPVLSPCVLDLDPARFTPGSGTDLQQSPYTSRAVLTDGGVYDNLGLETAWKHYDTILVSDAGGHIAPEPKPSEDWGRHSKRVLDVVDNQVRSLRKRALIASFQAKPEDEAHRKGAYWGIRTDIRNYAVVDAMNCPHVRTMELAEVPTRLDSMPAALQDRLVNWGYAVCDAAVRRHVDPGVKPGRFPRPGGV